MTVFAINIAMVIGPTPPGTGVMALHLGATDELIGIIRSGNSTVLTADNLIKTAAFV